jgi:hypothetical protein
LRNGTTYRSTIPDADGFFDFGSVPIAEYQITNSHSTDTFPFHITVDTAVTLITTLGNPGNPTKTVVKKRACSKSTANQPYQFILQGKIVDEKTIAQARDNGLFFSLSSDTIEVENDGVFKHTFMLERESLIRPIVAQIYLSELTSFHFILQPVKSNIRHDYGVTSYEQVFNLGDIAGFK